MTPKTLARLSSIVTMLGLSLAIAATVLHLPGVIVAAGVGAMLGGGITLAWAWMEEEDA